MTKTDQIAALQREVETLKRKNMALVEDKKELQVENDSLTTQIEDMLRDVGFPKRVKDLDGEFLRDGLHKMYGVNVHSEVDICYDPETKILFLGNYEDVSEYFKTKKLEDKYIADCALRGIKLTR
jgi:FtsZ-binding cell division protein ZapB